MTASCRFCGRELPTARTNDDPARFCSDGCRHLHDDLGPSDEKDRTATAVEDSAGATARTAGAGPPPDETGAPDDSSSKESRRADAAVEQTYLRVDGMHSVTCERFLESVARSREGVVDATASYVSETVRVAHRPETVSEQALCEALSTLGYSAAPRTDETAGPGVAGDDQQSERELEDLLGYRYAAGVVFGSFLLLPYVAVFYPAHLSEYLDGWLGEAFEGAVTFQGAGGFMLLQLFLVLTGVVLFFTALPVLRGAYTGLKLGHPNTDLLVALTIVAAFLYSPVAALTGRTDVFFDLTILVGAIVVAAVFYEALCKQRALDHVTELTVAQVTEARLVGPNGNTTVPVESLDGGDRVLVRRGERIPVDGILDRGSCTVDEAIVTGESLPSRKRPGDRLVGGSTVTDGMAVVDVAEDPTSRMGDLVERVWDIQSLRHGSQRRANAIASLVAPIVLGLAGVAGVVTLVGNGAVVPALLTALVVVLVASPWALGLATPLSVAAGVRAAMERGIVVFDDTVFDRLRRVEVVVFDKTGTLTTGQMTVVEATGPPDLLDRVAALEERAAHPAGRAIARAFDGVPTDDAGNPGGSGATDDVEQSDRIGAEPSEENGGTTQVADFQSHGNGVEGVVDGQRVLVGNAECFADRGWAIDDELLADVEGAQADGDLPVVIGREGSAEGFVVLRDADRDGVDRALAALAERGVKTVVLTGDSSAAASRFDQHPAVDAVYASVPPTGKTAAVRRLQAEGDVLMVGDGTNDAPALARADVGLTLGSGTALATDAADVTLTTDSLRAIDTALELGDSVRRRTAQNTGFALLYNAIGVSLWLTGHLNPVFLALAVVSTAALLAANVWRPVLDTRFGTGR